MKLILDENIDKFRFASYNVNAVDLWDQINLSNRGEYLVDTFSLRFHLRILMDDV